MKPKIEDFVDLCLEQAGERYVYGAEVALDTDLDGPERWDCSELVQVCAHQVGGFMPDGSAAQLDWCIRNGTQISVALALATRGALLFIQRRGHHHVAVSLGTRPTTTIEARGSAYGVGSFTGVERGWTHGGLLPGFAYTGHDDTDEEDDMTKDQAIMLERVEKALYKEKDGQEYEHLNVVENLLRAVGGTMGLHFNADGTIKAG